MTQITIETTVHKDVESVWKMWNDPDCVVEWNHASDDWFCPKAINNLVVGGSFSFTMSAKDKSMSFDFEGAYSKIKKNKLIAYSMPDGRKVETVFETVGDGQTKIIETFDAETTNSIERQRAGWSAILQNFKQFCESKKKG